MMRTLPLLLGFAMAGCAVGRGMPPGASRDDAIPHVAGEGVIDWKVVADDAVYVRGTNGRWYLVRTTGLCPRLAGALTLGFETGGSGQLDRYGAILAGGDRCMIASVAASTPPARLPGHGRITGSAAPAP